MTVFSIIVTFNAEKWVRNCFNSLQNSLYPVSVIVVDNGSTDDTINIIRSEFPQLELIISDVNLGFAKANNIGIKKAYDNGADYVFLLNQDAWIKPDTIDCLVNKFKSKTDDFGILSPIHLNGSGTALDYNFSTYISPRFCPNLLSDLIVNNSLLDLYETSFVNAAAWMLSKKCIETIGGFNSLFHLYGEDDDYVNRLHYHKLKLGVVPSAFIYHDREQRKVPKRLVDTKLITERKLLNKYLNLNRSYDINQDISQLTIEGFKAMIKLNFTAYRALKKKRTYLKSIKAQVVKSRELTSKPGLNFLQ